MKTNAQNSTNQSSADNEWVHRLLVLRSPSVENEGRPILLPAARSMSFGSGVGSELGSRDIPLTGDPYISKLHCSIQHRANGCCYLTHLSGTNPTYVNRERVQTVELQDSDVIRIGDHLLLYQRLGPELVAAILSGENDADSPIEGVSAHLAVLRQKVARIGHHEGAHVLVLGETGTGKEVTVQALHRALEAGKPRPLVEFNASAIPESLAPSSLFGHVKGAFTGADSSKKGMFVEADGGTLFIDELGDLPMKLQPQLLRALEGRVCPVGGTKELEVRSRIVSATNRDLVAAMSRGEFRTDLYARLQVHTLPLTPLRKRRDDILFFFQRFLESARDGKVPRLTANAAEALLCYNWPGNVREVRHLAIAIATSGGDFAGKLHSHYLRAQRPELFDNGPLTEPQRISSFPIEDDPRLTERPGHCPQTGDTLLRMREVCGSVLQTAHWYKVSNKTIHNWASKLGKREELLAMGSHSSG